MIACGNVTSLLLARASGRRKEFALRVALGAGRLRLIRQLLTESLVLSGLGAVVSLLLVLWMQQIVPLLQPPGERMLAWNFTPDVRVLAFTMALALITGLIFGLTPRLAIIQAGPDRIAAREERRSVGKRPVTLPASAGSRSGCALAGAPDRRRFTGSRHTQGAVDTSRIPGCGSARGNHRTG